MITCPLTGSSNVGIIYEQENVPLYQNIVYNSADLAKSAKKTKVTLAQSFDNGFVFNASFDESLIDYNHHYQNEQSYSSYFIIHLRNVIEILRKHSLLSKRIVEIGCGKAFFLNLLSDQGENVIGFDPAYEGDSPLIIKDYFSDKYSDIGAETIILRHTLEHISNPYHFIQTIAKSNKYKGQIYIEVPTFDWIVKNNASEDIFYEHCNYFTLDTLKQFFVESTGGYLFNGQYIYVIAELGMVKESIENRKFESYNIRFNDKIKHYREIVSKHKNIGIWGAGAKGSTFLNLIDKNANIIKCVIDINPKKQNHYIGGTGHLIIKPEDIAKHKINTVLVMNVNYFDEIQLLADSLKIKLITL